MSGQVNRDHIASLPAIIRNSASTTLVVGDLLRWTAEGRMYDTLQEFKFVSICELDALTMNELDPDIILSPLVADEFDAIDVALKLIALEFDGKYRAISNTLPDADLIRKEVQSLSSTLDFDLLLVPQGQQSMAHF